MQYKEYVENYGTMDHVLIRMVNSFPYFKEKKIVENGVERIATNYHVADGMFSTYINYEMDNGLCAEISKGIRFEGGVCNYPVLVTNVDAEPMYIRTESGFCDLKPGEVLVIRNPLECDVKKEDEGLLASLVEQLKQDPRIARVETDKLRFYVKPYDTVPYNLYYFASFFMRERRDLSEITLEEMSRFIIPGHENGEILI